MSGQSPAWEEFDAAVHDLSDNELDALIQSTSDMRDQLTGKPPRYGLNAPHPRPGRLYAAFSAILSRERHRRADVIRDARAQTSRVEAGWSRGRARDDDDPEPDVLGPFEGLGDPPREESPGDVGDAE